MNILKNRMLSMISGKVNQEDRLTFSFCKVLNRDIVEWLNEQNISFNERQMGIGEITNIAIVEFSNSILAMEFKLRWC